MKFITIQLTYENKDKEEILVIVSPINCSSDDELSIKRAIESRKNDPAITIGILTRNATQTIAEATIQKIKEAYSICSEINVTFANVIEITGLIKGNPKKRTFDFSQN